MASEHVLTLEVRREDDRHRSGIIDYEVTVRMTVKTESATDAAGAVLESLRDLLGG